MIRYRSAGMAMLALAMLSACQRTPSLTISGESTEEVAISVYSIGRQLPPEKRDAYMAAIELLARTAPDRYLAEKYMSITPNMVQSLRGRTASQVIQQAASFRSALPMVSLAEHHRMVREERPARSEESEPHE